MSLYRRAKRRDETEAPIVDALRKLGYQVQRRSVCNRYMVVDEDGRWQTWKMAPGGCWFRPLANGLQNEDEARAAAESDAETAIV